MNTWQILPASDLLLTRSKNVNKLHHHSMIHLSFVFLNLDFSHVASSELFSSSHLVFLFAWMNHQQARIACENICKTSFQNQRTIQLQSNGNDLETLEWMPCSIWKSEEFQPQLEQQHRSSWWCMKYSKALLIPTKSLTVNFKSFFRFADFSSFVLFLFFVDPSNIQMMSRVNQQKKKKVFYNFPSRWFHCFVSKTFNADT